MWTGAKSDRIYTWNFTFINVPVSACIPEPHPDAPRCSDSRLLSSTFVWSIVFGVGGACFALSAHLIGSDIPLTAELCLFIESQAGIAGLIEN